jgi:hypothetical protein
MHRTNKNDPDRLNIFTTQQEMESLDRAALAKHPARGVNQSNQLPVSVLIAFGSEKLFPYANMH